MRWFAPALRDGGGVVVAGFPGFPSWAIFASSLREEKARRIGATRQEVNRLTNLKHATKIDCIDAALRALGKRLYLDTV